HGEKHRLGVAIVADAAPDAGRNPDEIARAKRALDLTSFYIPPDARKLSFQHEEQFLDVGMQMQRTFVTGGENHRAEREVPRLDDVRIVVRAGRTTYVHLGGWKRTSDR